MTTTHHLKCIPPMFDAVIECEKVFELRVNDRFYQRGDYVVLHKFQPGSDLYIKEDGTHTKEQDESDWIGPFMIGYVIAGPALGIASGWCAFSLLSTPELEAQAVELPEEDEGPEAARGDQVEPVSKPH